MKETHPKQLLLKTSTFNQFTYATKNILNMIVNVCCCLKVFSIFSKTGDIMTKRINGEKINTDAHTVTIACLVQTGSCFE